MAWAITQYTYSVNLSLYCLCYRSVECGILSSDLEEGKTSTCSYNFFQVSLDALSKHFCKYFQVSLQLWFVSLFS